MSDSIELLRLAGRARKIRYEQRKYKWFLSAKRIAADTKTGAARPRLGDLRAFLSKHYIYYSVLRNIQTPGFDTNL